MHLAHTASVHEIHDQVLPHKAQRTRTKVCVCVCVCVCVFAWCKRTSPVAHFLPRYTHTHQHFADVGVFANGPSQAEHICHGHLA